MNNIKDRSVQSNNELSEYKQKEREEYISGDEKKKENYWISHIFKLLQNHRHLSSTHDPELINFSDFRKENQYLESNIDRFLPGILIGLQDYYGDEGNPLEIIFKLDEQAKRALELQSNIDKNLGQVNEVLDGGKTKSIEGIDISYEELAERIGDLYYDSLAVFIADLKDNIDNKEIKSLLNEAFSNISTAWGYCEKPVEDYLESIKEKPEKVKTFKHTNQIKGIGIDNKELAKRIGNLVNSELSKFLKALSEKIYKDGVADDKKRGRKKLATELYSCADKLDKASKLVINN